MSWGDRRPRLVRCSESSSLTRVDLEPVGSGRDRGYKFRGSLAIDRLISGDMIGTHLTVVAPTGFEPVFQP